jgi:outer membrane protein assembly factor BamA
VYTRHFMTANYTFQKSRNSIEARFLSGFIAGTAPLFERFSLGNCATLRGWNKFDVSPLGGSRTAHGSLEYRYSQFRIFYDAGTVWDSGRYNKVRHGLGFGWAHKSMFISLAFPVRLHDVAPVFMLGWRSGAR